MSEPTVEDTYIVEVKLTYRVANCTSEWTAARAVKSELFNQEIWHDEQRLGVERLALTTSASVMTFDF